MRKRAQVAPVDLRDASWTTMLDGPVDVVVSGFAIHHLPDDRKRALFAEIFARLVPGGTFLDLDHVASATPGVEALHDEAIVRFWAASRIASGRKRVRLDAVRAEYHGRPDKADNILAPVDVQCAWLRDIGFVDVDVFWKWFELALFGGQTPCS
jgi:SAM-dependent methyltransferase